MKLALVLLTVLTSAQSFAFTSLNAKNILGKYEMNGIVDLKVNLLPKNKVEATQIGIIFDTQCSGSYTYNPAKNELVADLDCEGDKLHQVIDFANTTLEDLKNGTQVHVSLDYKAEKYDFDFDVKKIQ